ncbi:MAG: dihydrodipicolinate synthase family protein [Gemmataceae bacterium]|nr:dihydrodipicolinate synthase family protein [Gemmataceae bacterium]
MMIWQGVIPAMTTPFTETGSVDHSFLVKHTNWLIDNGCQGIVALGSLGEGATLTFAEKVEVLTTCVKAIGDRAPVVAGVAALSTAEAVQIARAAHVAGCKGLMVLPPYVYSTDWREMKAHVDEVIAATPLSCMLYNNPIAYKTDYLPSQIAELANDHINLHAVKESSADVRRLAAIKSEIGNRLALLVGVDDMIVEGIEAGATGWIAGLVNALPKESVALFDFAMKGDKDKAFAIYRWFLPLLRMDVVVKFVQLIKLVQQEAGMGSERVRAPRLVLAGQERTEAQRIIARHLAERPQL